MNMMNQEERQDVKPAFNLNDELPLPRIVPVHLDVLPPRWAKFAKKQKVQLHLAVLYENEAGTGKLWPATNVLAMGVARGDHKGNRKAGDSTSGGYGVAMATAIKMSHARDAQFPIDGFVAIINNSLPEGKRKALTDLGVELDDKARTAVEAMVRAEELERDGAFWLTRQYWNRDNGDGYQRIAKHIAHSLPLLGLAAWGVGSGGGCSGVMPVLTQEFASRELPLRRIAVVVEDGEKVGGVRDEISLEPGTLDWRSPNIDGVRIVGESASYGFSAALWRQADFRSGPSTGFAAEGAMLAARELAIMRVLDEYRADDGMVHILAPSMDTRDPYEAEYAEKNIYF